MEALSTLGGDLRSIATRAFATPMHACALVLTLAAASAGAAPASAEDAPTTGSAAELDEEAHALYEAGVIAFEGGRFRNALDAFQRAYELSQRPALLYNIGTAADRMRLDAVALDAFERYIAEVPAGTHVDSVHARILVLRQAVEEERAARDAERLAAGKPDPMDMEAAESQPVAPPPPPPEKQSSWPKWALIGGGGALTAAGVVMLGIGQRNRSKIESAPPGSDYAQVSKYDNADTLTVTGAILGVAGLGAVVAGTVWLMGDEKQPGVALMLMPTGVGLRGTL